MSEVELFEKMLTNTDKSIKETFEINEFSIKDVLEVMVSIDQVIYFLHSDDLTNDVSPDVRTLLSFKLGLKEAVYDQINS